VDWEAPGMQTTLNLLEGGSISVFPEQGAALAALNDSRVNIAGGSVDFVFFACQNSQVTMTSGTVYYLYASGDTRIKIDGGWVGGYSSATDNSQVMITGGGVYYLSTGGNSQVTMTGGSVQWGLDADGDSHINIGGGWIERSLSAWGNTQVTMSGGSVNWLNAYGNSQVTMTGGSVSGYLYACGDSRINVDGGSVNGLAIVQDSQVTMTAGSVSSLRAFHNSQVNWSGGTVGYIWLEDQSVVTIEGSDFAIDGTPFVSGDITRLSDTLPWEDPPRRLTGILANGDIIDIDFYIRYDAKIVLAVGPAGWFFDSDFQYNLDNNYSTVEGNGHLQGTATLSGTSLFINGEVSFNGPLPPQYPEVYLIATNGPDKELTQQIVNPMYFTYNEVSPGTYQFSGSIPDVITPINDGHYEVSILVLYGAEKYQLFINTASLINKSYFPLVTFYQPPGYALIVAGDTVEDDWSQKRAINHSTNNAYRVLRNLGFDDDNISYLNTEPQIIEGQNVVDKYPSLDNLQSSLNEAKSIIGESGTPLIIYLVGHGIKEVFDFYTESDALSSTNLRDMLKAFDDNPVLIVIGSCYSGSFITTDFINDSISADNRIIITATRDNLPRLSILGLGGWYHSSDRFWGNLNKGLNVKDAFITNAWQGELWQIWLDDNGDSIGHTPYNLDSDGQLAAITQIGVPGTENLKLIPWYMVWKHSPGELRVYDSQNRITGLFNGEIKEEIPGSIYDEENEIVAIFDPCGTYRYEVLSTSEGTYGLDIGSIKGGETETFTAIEIPTSPNAVHQYTMDWAALSQGKAGATLRIDAEGDGLFERTIISDNKLTACKVAIELIGYELISQKKISETEFEYIFRLLAKNTGGQDVKNITLRLAGEPNGTSIIDGVVYFSTIQAGEQLLSDDTFTVRSTKGQDVLESELIWQVCKCVERPKSDFSHDWTVSLADLAEFTDRWLNSCSEPNWCQGTDLNYNRFVDFADFALFADNWLWEIIPADFNIDGEVEFADYAVLANQWRAGNCAESAWCDGADLNKSSSVDLFDLAEFAEHWLEGITP
jgi:hypothetical protein